MQINGGKIIAEEKEAEMKVSTESDLETPVTS